MATKRNVEDMRRQLEAAVVAAKARIEAQSSKAIRQVRQNAERKEVAELVEACDAELALRGAHDFTTEEALEALEVAGEVATDEPLRERILAAFTALPARDYEMDLVRVIDAHPGASFAQIHKEYPRKDTALVAGDLVYDRFGYFRSFVDDAPDQSSILLITSTEGRKVTWQLRPEAREAFASLGVLQPSA